MRRALGLSRRGWTVAGAGASLIASGRLLGADELSVLGLAALATLVGALAWMTLAHPGLDARRHVHPLRLHVDDHARVDLAVAARRRTPLIEIVEPIDDGRLRARFLVTPLAPGGAATPAYRLPTDHRGAVKLGPTIAVHRDPLGLAQRGRIVAAPETVLVRPRVHRIAPPPLGGGRRHAVEDAESPRALASDVGGEFLAVRPYEVGDDPRRVHWRSTARMDDLMVRQYVAPRRGHTLVIVDTRAADGLAPTDAAFEHSVEAAASIIAALHRARRPFECMTSGGTVLAPLGADPQRAYDRLATVLRDEPDLLDAVARSRRPRPPEMVVLATSRADRRVVTARQVLARHARSMLVVTGGDPGDPHGPSSGVVDARARSFTEAWGAAVRARPIPAPAAPGPLAVVR